MASLSFFFQAEGGIRGGTVTGVQTCALPICAGPPAGARAAGVAEQHAARGHARGGAGEIGRASCRERVLIWVVDVLIQKKHRNILAFMFTNGRPRVALWSTQPQLTMLVTHAI